MTVARPCIKPTEQRRKTADTGFSNANISVASTSKGLQSAVAQMSNRNDIQSANINVAMTSKGLQSVATQNSNKNDTEMNANANIASSSSGLQLPM